MKQSFTKLIGLCCTLSLTGLSYAQEDVTATYLNNPSFEADAGLCTQDSEDKVTESSDGLRGWNIKPSGWNITPPSEGKSLLINKDCFTDNGFGPTTIADGDYAYYQRFGWGSASSVLSQATTKKLAAGEYELTFVTKAFAANGATSFANINIYDEADKSLGNTSFICEAAPEHNNVMTNSEWTTHSIKFIVDADTKITITAEMSWGNGGSQIAYDNFKLTKLPDGSYDPDAPVIEGDTEDKVSSPTEGVITHDFVSETDMQKDLLQMLANSMQYAKNIWFDCKDPNSKNEVCGYFKAKSAGQNNEDGVRTNADFSMICAFVYKYGKDKVTLPAGMTWDEVKDMAMKSLVFGYSTHKANKFKITSNNAYWGSVSSNDHVWESSLWAMSLAYASHFLSDELSEAQKTYVYNMIKAECNYELQRSIPTGYNGDTKAEENGWETNILACALGLYPNDALAPQWFARLREFAINCYSQIDDANNNTVIDPEYDQTTVKDLYKGKNLYDDYTLQNHNYFHTSYQNVVMQELGESYLALKLFQGENEKWKTNALMHNNQNVMDEVLCQLALADGELAMPNGNDWSMFLYDQITSYTTAACFLRDPNALLLENLAYKNIKARQTTTSDGSWLLNSDIGPRRMGVEGHRVMMTYLMHELASTNDLQPTTWSDFSKKYEAAKLFTSQNIIRANTKDRFSVFSWSNGLKSYTGYIAANNPDKNKIIVPYKANNTGNIIGWYTVNGKGTNASPLVSGIYNLEGNSYTMNGKLSTNDNSLENNFTLYSTPGNAFIYMDYVIGKTSGTITSEQGGLMAISVDPFTKEQRTLYYDNGRFQSDGKQLKDFKSQWVNIDNQVGIITSDAENNMAFGNRELNSSIYLAKIYPSYNSQIQNFTKDQIVDRRHIVYYSNINADLTKELSGKIYSLTNKVPEGWNGVIVTDTDNALYLLMSNYCGDISCTLNDISTENGAPVFTAITTIKEDKASATFRCDANHSVANSLRVFVKGNDLQAWQAENDSCAAYINNAGSNEQTANVTILYNGQNLNAEVPVKAASCVLVSVKDGVIVYEDTEIKEDKESFRDVTALFLKNPSFEEDKTYGKTGSVTLGSTTYNPCYINDVPAVNSKWAQILPIEGWTNGNELVSTGGSNFCVLYSMPYSTTMYCVSPSNVGNSASIMAEPAINENCGERCLSVLNSWDSGLNRITQKVTLPAGEYKLKFLMQYVCPNEMRHTGNDIITTTSDNINYSYCGISYNGKSDYRYPQYANNWEEIVCPFTLDEPTEVTISMGLKTTASVGAANNTRLYIDNVRLYSKEEVKTFEASVYNGTETPTKVLITQNGNMELEDNAIAYVESPEFTPSPDAQNIIVKQENGTYVCQNLTLTDKKAFYAPTDFTASKISYRYSHDYDCTWGALVVPFALDATMIDEEDVTLYQPATVVNDNFAKDEAYLSVQPLSSSLPANTPVVFQTATQGEDLHITANDINISATPQEMKTVITQDGYTLYGTYQPISSIRQGDFILDADKFIATDSENTKLSPFRCYITAPADAEGIVTLKPHIGEVTGVHTVSADNANTDIHNINGMLIRHNVSPAEITDKLPDGIYIINGKKVHVQ